MNQLQQPSNHQPTVPDHINLPLFSMGQIVATPGSLEVFEQYEDKSIQQYIHNHQHGDWGELCPEDQQSNDYAVKNGGRILSSYLLGHQKVWVITEADRSVTTVLLPSEY